MGLAGWTGYTYRTLIVGMDIFRGCMHLLRRIVTLIYFVLYIDAWLLFRVVDEESGVLSMSAASTL
jgi:hypothetical protein